MSSPFSFSVDGQQPAGGGGAGAAQGGRRLARRRMSRVLTFVIVVNLCAVVLLPVVFRHPGAAAENGCKLVFGVNSLPLFDASSFFALLCSVLVSIFTKASLDPVMRPPAMFLHMVSWIVGISVLMSWAGIISLVTSAYMRILYVPVCKHVVLARILLIGTYLVLTVLYGLGLAVVNRRE